MKSFQQFMEETDMTSDQYNKMQSRRQLRDKRRSRSEVRSEFDKSDKFERRKMYQARKDVNEETYDPEVQGRSQIRKTGEGGRLYPSKKKSKPEIRRQKAIGGGKTAPVEYKDRKDIGKAELEGLDK